MNVKIKMTRAENIAQFGTEPTEIPLEEYLYGVVPAEVYESSHMGALKAQAVTARTFALRRALTGTVMDDTTSFQAYRYDRIADSPRSKQAVKETTGQVLCYNGEIVDCFYSASNGGQTKRSGDVWSKHYPYYVNKTDEWDIAANAEKPMKASHGIGLSQIGAMWAAKNDIPYNEILAFYYDGTAIVSDYGNGGAVDFGGETQETGGYSMNLKTLLFTKNGCYLAGKTIAPQGIMVHSTGANNPNLKRYVGPDDGLLGENKSKNYWNQATPDGRQVCVHAFIGKLADGTIATYQTLPWNHRGWHAGGAANNTHISFEICEDGLTDASYFKKVFQEAVELCAYLCKMYNLDPLKDGVIIGHYEGYKRGIASNHADPGHWFPKHGESMDSFRATVKKALNGSSTATPTEPAPTPEKETAATLYRVRKSWSDSKSQKGAFKILDNAKKCADENTGYSVFDESGKAIYASSSSDTGSSVPYQVRVKIGDLNIRKGPGTDYSKTGKYTGIGTFTIVEKQSGQGSTAGWGKLKSDAGWISLDYCTKV